MPPVTLHNKTTYTCLEPECGSSFSGRGVATLKDSGYQHLVIDHADKYKDIETFLRHYRTYFRNYYKIR